MFWEKDGGLVRCKLCPHECEIAEGKTGLCKVRKNVDGTLVSLNYNRLNTAAVDPIEKKPLFHFYPGSDAFSMNAVGCNLFCKGCLNWRSSKEFEINDKEVSAKEIIEICKKSGCKIIAFTYTEPTVYYEYMLDIAKLAKKNGLKTVMVSNGYINEGPLKRLIPYLDAANIDLKAFSEEFYKKWGGGSLEPVLNSIKMLCGKIHLELTNLIIPGRNEDVEEMCRWIRDNLGNDVVLHFSRFHPCYKATEKETPRDVMLKAFKIGKKYVNYVYIGNMEADYNTYCPKCKKIVVKRDHFNGKALMKGVCECGQKIYGKF